MAAPRKSRRRRLGLVGGSWSTEFELSANKWKGIERAYGYKLPVNARQAIIVAVRAYHFSAPFETNAPFESDLNKWLTSIGIAALNLAKALLSVEPAIKLGGFAEIDRLKKAVIDKVKIIKTRQELNPEEMEALNKDRAGARNKELAAASIVKELLLTHVRFSDFAALRNLPGGDAGWDLIVALPYTIATGVRRAKKNIHENAIPSHTEGESWASLMRELTTVCEKHGLPTGASKGRAKSKNGTSHFVRMVAALQGHFPEHLQRHGHGEDGLAWAIGEARSTTGALKGTTSRERKSAKN